MKGKANPFANLISKLATTSSNSGSTSPVKANMPDIDEENEENTADSSSENNIANTATAATSAAVTTTDTDIGEEIVK